MKKHKTKNQATDPMNRATHLCQIGFCLGLGSLVMVYIFLFFIDFALDTMEGKDALYVSMFFILLAIGTMHYWWMQLRRFEPTYCARKRTLFTYLRGVAATLSVGGTGCLIVSLLLFLLNGRRYRLHAVVLTENIGMIALYIGFFAYLTLHALDVRALKQTKAERTTQTTAS